MSWIHEVKYHKLNNIYYIFRQIIPPSGDLLKFIYIEPVNCFICNISPSKTLIYIIIMYNLEHALKSYELDFKNNNNNKKNGRGEPRMKWARQP
jgi:hypothetical protein